MNQLTPALNILIGVLVLALIVLALIALKYAYRWIQSNQTQQTQVSQQLSRKHLLQDTIKESLGNREQNSKQNLIPPQMLLPRQKEQCEDFRQVMNMISVMGQKQQLKIRNQLLTELQQLSNRETKAVERTIMNQVFAQSPYKVMTISYLLKYSLIGSFFNADKKYLLKEFTIISLFVVSVLSANHILLWPLAIGAVWLVITFLLYEYAMKSEFTTLQNLLSGDRNKIHSGVQNQHQVQHQNQKREQVRISKVQRERHLQRLENNIQPIYPVISNSNSNSNTNLHFQLPLALTNLNEAFGQIQNEDPSTKRRNSPLKLNDPNDGIDDTLVAATARIKNSQSQRKKKLSPVKPRNILQPNMNHTNSPIKMPRNILTKKERKKKNTDSPIKILRLERDTQILTEQNPAVPKRGVKRIVRIGLIGIVAFLTTVLFSQGMFTIYNSLSNLGVINVQSWLLMLVIDQLAIRVGILVIGVGLTTTLQLIGSIDLSSKSSQKVGLESQNRNQDSKFNSRQSKNMEGYNSPDKAKQLMSGQNNQSIGYAKSHQQRHNKGKAANQNGRLVQVTEFPILGTLCEDYLYQKMQLIKQQRYKAQVLKAIQRRLSQQQVEQSVSPTRKKENSPSRVPCSLSRSKQNYNSIEKGCFSKKSIGRQNVLNDLDDQEQIEQYDINLNQRPRTIDFHSHSAQRPIKAPENLLRVNNFNDDLVLVDNILNYIDEDGEGQEKEKKQQYQNEEQQKNRHFHSIANDFRNLTLDIDFSPTKQTRRRARTRKNKRTLVMTGSSPYLEYLPNMMKKVDRHNLIKQNQSKKDFSALNRGTNRQSFHQECSNEIFLFKKDESEQISRIL